jgi:transcription elongation GreA/GreB family factor
MTPEGRKRLSEALKARWAAKKAGASAPAKEARSKGGMTPEGRKRLSEALRKRWAAKRAAAAAPAKKAAAK